MSRSSNAFLAAVFAVVTLCVAQQSLAQAPPANAPYTYLVAGRPPATRASELGVLPAGDIDLLVVPRTSSGSEQHFHFSVRDSATLRAKRLSRAGERMAGGILIAAGWIGGAALLGAGIAGDVGCSWLCGLSTAAGVAGLITSGLLFTALGLPLVFLRDATVLQVREADGSTRILVPDHAEARIAADVVLSGVAFGSLLAAGVLLHGSDDSLVDASLALSLVAMPLLVTAAGALTGSSGDLVGATLGALALGAPVFLLASIPMFSSDAPAGALAFALGVAIPFALLGAILGYEIQNGWERTALERGERHTTHVLPSIAILPNGAALTVDGTF